MFSQNLSFTIYETTFRIVFPGILFNKIRIFSILYKTNILTVMFFRIDKAMGFCNLSGFCLFHAAQRKHGMCQLFLCHGIKNVALIFCRIHCFFQKISVFLLIIFNLCVMSRHHIIISQFFCPAKQFFKLQISVAVNTGIGSHTIFIGFYKMVNDILFESVRKIQHIIGHIQ